MSVDESRARIIAALEGSGDLLTNERQAIAEDLRRFWATPEPLRTIASHLDRLGDVMEAAFGAPAVDVQAVQEAPRPPLAGWAYLELMGRRVLPAAWVEEDDLVGRPMLRVRRLVLSEATNLPLGTPTPALELEERFRIYSPATVYSIEWITEAEARERWLAWNGSRHDDGDDIPF